jgi:hypothetical protein
VQVKGKVVGEVRDCLWGGGVGEEKKIFFEKVPKLRPLVLRIRMV